jgi:glycine/D-amino acid oxidase-like deaminating enzyme
MKVDVAIIGGGYYGCAAAIEIRTTRPDLNVVVIEREASPFKRASSTNQGQLHAGYMYSKFPELARECANGAKEFVHTYGEAVNQDILTYYGVHRDSEISAGDYEAFCKDVGLPLRPVAPPKDFFGPSLARVYETAEKTFDNTKLHAIMVKQLATSGAQLVTSFAASKVQQTLNGFEIKSTDGRSIQAQAVFNTTFADSNKLHEQSGIAKLPLDHAVFLHFLIELPARYTRMGLIVVRGAYAALAPAAPDSPASHIFASGQFRVVRASHVDAPSEAVTEKEVADRYEQAVTEASSYMPYLRSARLVGRIVGTRTNYVEPTTGVAASRAVVLRDYAGVQGYHCVFGGKVTCLPEITQPVRRIAQAIKR